MRDKVRRVMFVAIAVLAMVLMMFERHKTDHHEWHATTSREIEDAFTVWAMGAVVCGLLALALRFGLVLGIVASVVSTKRQSAAARAAACRRGRTLSSS